MNTKQRILAGIFLLLCTATMWSRADENSALKRKAEEQARIEREIEKYHSEFPEDEADALSRIRKNIESETLNFDLSRQEATEIQEKLSEIRNEITTLEGQLHALDLVSKSAKKQIETVKQRIMERIADIKFLSEEKEKLEAEKDRALRVALDFFALLQIDNTEFGNDDELRNTIRLLLSDESFSQNFWKSDQNAAMERAGRKVFHNFEEKERTVKEVEKLITLENQRLSELYDRKKAEERNIAAQTKAKKRLKEVAEKSESEFEKLLEESRKQMAESVSAITRLRYEREAIEKKLADFAAAQSQKEESEAKFLKNVEKVGDEILGETQNKIPFSWPVKPTMGISAGFHDPEYKKIFGVSHEGIDIPTPQGTSIRAPALGYVYSISNNGDGYNSLILAHQGNLLTVFGHVSAFLVKEGDLVREGDPIALSGGTPGTPGAGWMTTGPHLHFEVLRNEQHLNPLDYLPPLPKEKDKEIEKK